MDTLVLGAAALIPVLVLMIFIYIKDPHEKEPIGLLVKIFFLGMLSCIPAAIYENIGQDILGDIGFSQRDRIYWIITAYGIVALAEESVKYAALKLSTWKNKNFNYRFDGIVYAVFASLGFAALENVLYVFESGFNTAIARALLSVPGHCNFGIFMGYFYGQAKYREAVGDYTGCVMKRRTGLLVAILFHGTYDCLLFLYSAMHEGIYIVSFIIFVVVLDIMALVRVHRSSKEEFHRTLATDDIFVTPVMSGAPQYPYQQSPYDQNYGSQYYGGDQYGQQYQQPYGRQYGQPYQQQYQSPYAGTSYAGANRTPQDQTSYNTIFCNYCGTSCKRQSFYCTTCGRPLYRM